VRPQTEAPIIIENSGGFIGKRRRRDSKMIPESFDMDAMWL
jgi:hypothetical protein